MNRLNKTESAIYWYCRFSFFFFLKDPFLQIILQFSMLQVHLISKETSFQIIHRCLCLFSRAGPEGVGAGGPDATHHELSQIYRIS